MAEHMFEAVNGAGALVCVRCGADLSWVYAPCETPTASPKALKVVGSPVQFGRRVFYLLDEIDLREFISQVEHGFFGVGGVTIEVGQEDLSVPRSYWINNDGKEEK